MLDDLQQIDLSIQLLTALFKQLVLHGWFSAATAATTTVQFPVAPRSIGKRFACFEIFEENLLLRGNFESILVFKVDLFISLFCIEFTYHAVLERKRLESDKNFA